MAFTTDPFEYEMRKMQALMEKDMKRQIAERYEGLAQKESRPAPKPIEAPKMYLNNKLLLTLKG